MNKNYLLYIGVFLAGAIITPLYLSVFNNGSGGDRPEADGESFDEINLDLTANSDSFSSDQESESGQVFVPNDSQEVILNDYPTVESKPVPTGGLPEFARNQPSIAPYPNYGSPRIPSFTTTQPTPNAASPQATSRPQPAGVQSPSVTVNPQVISNATPPVSDLFQSIPANVFTPPKDMPNSNAAASPSFAGSFQASDNFDLKSFTGSPAMSLQNDGTANSGAQ
ncbi:MAG: hypothetical protein HC799_13500 [Limnothrix sp. RL_2_0]|nr:hypothetical protein [Limnothrix sp. RL_2_0]